MRGKSKSERYAWRVLLSVPIVNVKPDLASASSTVQGCFVTISQTDTWIFQRAHPITDTWQMTKTASKIRFKSETLPAGRERQGRLVDVSHPATERQCEAPVAPYDCDRWHHQWRAVSSHARARRPKKPLAQGRPPRNRYVTDRLPVDRTDRPEGVAL